MVNEVSKNRIVGEWLEIRRMIRAAVGDSLAREYEWRTREVVLIGLLECSEQALDRLHAIADAPRSTETHAEGETR